MFRLPDRYLAEDAVQETFLKVFRYFDDYRHKGRFRAFLYKVAGNTCIDMMRKKQWDPIPEDAAQEESGMRKTEEQHPPLQRDGADQQLYLCCDRYKICFHRKSGNLDAVPYDGGGSHRNHSFYPSHSGRMVQEKRVSK